MRVAAIRLYENVIAKFKTNEGWLKDIECNIGVKQGCPLSPTHFGIYIDKLEGCLEDGGCVIRWIIHLSNHTDPIWYKVY